MNFRAIGAIATILLLLSAVPHLLAQGSDLGTIQGTVKDASGAVIPQAKIIITDLSTNTDRETASNGQGDYSMSGLKSGAYKVSVSSPGMTTEEIRDVQVNGSSTVGMNVTLRVSNTSEKIEVVAEAASIDTEDSTISDTIGHAEVIDLPRDSRDVYSFLYLNPNITQADGPGSFKFIGSQSYGASFSLDGQRSNGGIFGQPTSSEPSLEAVDEINVLSSNFSAEYAGVDNIRVTTKRGGDGYHGSIFYNNSNSAFAALSLQDRAALASFSPTPFESKFPTPYFNLNDLGGAVGGPIRGLKKTWFFAAYERDYALSPTSVQSTTFPHPSLWTGNFSLLDPSALPDVPNGVVLTPQEMATDTYLGLGQQFTQIPTRLLNPTVQNLINKYFPHIGVSAPIDSFTGRISPAYQTEVPGRDTLDTGSLRLDHDFSENDHVYVSYNVSADTHATAPVDGTGNSGAYLGLGLTQVNRQNHTVALSYTKIFKPNLINEARGGFNRQNLLEHSNTTLIGFLSGIGFDSSDIAAYGSVVGSLPLATYGHPAISFSNAFATFSNGGRNTYRPQNQSLITFGDTLTWVAGKHNLKMGGDFVRNQAIDGFAFNRGNPRGLMTYAVPKKCVNSGPCNGSKVDTFADFLLGLPPTSASYVLQPRPAMNVYNWEQGYFAQDDWKISSRLTVNLGLRYDLITPFVEQHDLLVNFDPNYVNPANGNAGRFIIPSNQTLQYLDPRIVAYGYATAGQVGLGRGLVHTDRNDYAPRIGVAYRIGDKTVLRAGYGLFYPTSAAQGIRDAIGTNPFNQGLTVKGALEGWPGPGQHGISPITGGTVQGLSNTVTANAVPFNLKEPRIQQYNVTVEREITSDSSLRLSYLGSHMGGLITGVDLNELAPNNTPFGTTQGDGVTICDPTQGTCNLSPADLARYKFPIIGENLFSYGNHASGNSHAFQTEFMHRYKHGVMLDMSYTYLDQKSAGLDTANSSLGGATYDPFTSAQTDYSTDSFVSRNRFVAYGVFDLPVGKGRRWGNSFSRVADTLLGGWQATFNMFAKSGTGFTPFWICDDCDPVEPGNIAVNSIDAVGDFNNEPSFRPTVVSNNVYTGQKGSGATIWNVNAFGVPSVGSDLFTNSAALKRNALIGPGSWGANLGVHKAFPIGERVVATLGADVDNIFNHPLFSPDYNYGGGGGPFAQVGDFNITVDQNTGQVQPISPANVNLNPLFGQLVNSFAQEGINAQRSIRLRLRITF